MKLYQIKLANGYVKTAMEGIFNEITFSPDITKMKLLDEKQKNYVLSVFPQAEVKTLNVTEQRNSLE